VNVPLLHVIATDEVVETPAFLPAAREMIAAGRKRMAIHLRLRRASGRAFHDLARQLSEAAAEAGAWCVVNGRLDVALTSHAQAVQLGSGSLPVNAARRVSGGLAIGASVHSADEARARVREGADYLVAGSVFPTTTHPDRVPAGVALVASCARAGAPVVAIGGIDADNAARVMAAGASGIAVIRACWQAPQPIGAFLQLIEVASAEGDRRQAADRAVPDAGSAAGTQEGSRC
jgi:thiamine-phosphate pyrophosphorylase